MPDYLANDGAAIAARMKQIAEERKPKPVTWETAEADELDGFAKNYSITRLSGESDSGLRGRIRTYIYDHSNWC